MKQFIIIAFLGLSVQLFGQDSTQFVISSKASKFKLQLNIGYEGSFVNQSGIHSLGAELGLLFKRRFYLGIYNYFSINEPRNIVVSSIPFDAQNIGFYQVGGRLGYHFRPYKAIHVAAQSQFGVVSIYDYDDNDIDLLSKNTFAVTPSLEAELNLTRSIKLAIGAGYRFVDQNELFFKQNKVNGFVYNATFRFGRFAR